MSSWGLEQHLGGHTVHDMVPELGNAFLVARTGIVHIVEHAAVGLLHFVDRF